MYATVLPDPGGVDWAAETSLKIKFIGLFDCAEYCQGSWTSLLRRAGLFLRLLAGLDLPC